MNFKVFTTNKYVTLSIKILFTLLCFTLLYIKIDFKEVVEIIKTTNFLYLTVALLFFILSKYISAVRLKVFLDLINIPISNEVNLKLYLLGMYYNLFLPGGVGGDGYKAYFLKQKNEDVPLKKILLALLFDRLNGFAVLCILMLLIFHFVDLSIPFKTILTILCIVMTIALLISFSYLFFKESLKKFILLLFYSSGVQISQLLSVFFILLSLNLRNDFIEMIFVFLISGITAMLPITIGGTGLRELTFIYFSDYLNYDKSGSVTVAVLFFIITTVVSLSGMYYNIKPEKLTS